MVQQTVEHPALRRAPLRGEPAAWLVSLWKLDSTRHATAALCVCVLLIVVLGLGLRATLEVVKLESPSIVHADADLVAATHMTGELLVIAGVLALVLGDLLIGTFVEQARAKDRLEAVMEAAPTGILIVTRSGALQFANAEAERMFGYSREEFLALTVEQLVPQRIRVKHPELRARFLDAPAKRTMGTGADLVAVRKDGGEFFVEVGLSPIPSPDRGSTMVVVADISARKRWEEALRISNAELEQFAYVASHDLQEPLRMVASFTQLLAEKYEGQLDERARRYINYAVEGAQRMQGLVRDLLNYSRVGAPQRSRKPIKIAALVDEVAGLMGNTVARPDWEIVTELAPDIVGDERQLSRVFQNLFSNSLKFRSDTPVRIEVSGQLQGATVVVTVADNGIGIAPKHFDRVFQMFQRLHSREKYEGSGIGLSIVKKIVEGHGGRIWIEPGLDKGIKVRFTLPSAGVGDEATRSASGGGQ